MPIKSKVFIQTLQKSQDSHKISFAFEFNNKNTKKVFVTAFFGWGRCFLPIFLIEGGGWLVELTHLYKLVKTAEKEFFGDSLLHGER